MKTLKKQISVLSSAARAVFSHSLHASPPGSTLVAGGHTILAQSIRTKFLPRQMCSSFTIKCSTCLSAGLLPDPLAVLLHP